MRRKLARMIVVVMLVFAIGAHWALLQSVAWVGMLVSYSQNAPFRVALRHTFDGEHPCKLCRVVQAGQKHEKKREASTLKTKLDFCPWSEPIRLQSPPPFPLIAAAIDFARGRSDPPPVPPPRPS